MSSKIRTALVWVLLIGLIVYLGSTLSDSTRRADYGEFFRDLQNGSIDFVVFDDGEIYVTQKNGVEYRTEGYPDTELLATLDEASVTPYFESGGGSSSSWMIYLLPVAVLLAFIFFLRKSQQGAGASFMALAKSRARVLPESGKVTFADVGGCGDAKEQLGDVVDFLKAPKRWAASGARLPRGILLEGPPGCGKTLLARAVAGETDAKFYVVSASEFVELFVGVGAARVRDMFETASRSAPAVIFIDELDAIGRRRGSGLGSSHDEREQTLNQILVCLDGITDKGEKGPKGARGPKGAKSPKGRTALPVVVLAATNRVDCLDAALLRPGRFDRRVVIGSPTEAERAEILRIHARSKSLDESVDLDELAARTAGLTGADLECVLNEAALIAVRRRGREDRGRGDDRSGRDERDDRDGTPARIERADIERALEPMMERESRFDRLDSLLIESESQLAEPAGTAVARLTFEDGSTLDGEIVWANATLIKVRRLDVPDGADESESTMVVPKGKVVNAQSLPGTDRVRADEIVKDVWRGHVSDAG